LGQSLLFNQEWAGVAEVALLAALSFAEWTYSPCNVFLLLGTDPFYSSFTLGAGGAAAHQSPEASPHPESTLADVAVQNYSFSGKQPFTRYFRI